MVTKLVVGCLVEQLYGISKVELNSDPLKIITVGIFWISFSESHCPKVFVPSYFRLP